MFAQIPPRQHIQTDTHAYWEGFLSPQEITQICALPNWHNINLAEVGVGKNGAVDLNKRRSNVAWFTPTKETEEIWSKIINTIADVNRQFFHYDLTGCYEPAQLTLYKAEDTGHYDWHVDHAMSATTTPRKLSMSLLLSDPSEFQGGEFQIKPHSDEILTLEQKQGRAWFFPSYTLHRVAPVTQGIRRSLVLWIGGPAFK
jgi:PKHD-type hydroxylase